MLSLRVAHAYDRNRYHPPEVSGRVATNICEPVERAFREGHFLEVGVGTGRIAMPIVARGYRFTGLDVDAEMMELFRAKCAGVSRKVSLVRGDAQVLPFEAESFHGVIAVHVWHLVPDLGLALDEALRVLKPGGFLFEGWDAPVSDGPEQVGRSEYDIQNAWCQAIKPYGFSVQRGSHRAALKLSAEYLAEKSLSSEERIVARWEVVHTPAEVLEALAEGLLSFTRNVPVEVRVKATRDVKQQLLGAHGELDVPIRTPWAFHLRITKVN
jgi:ubiquinone/menaquinone biosynthesis C-methylase UbiE